MAIRKVAHTGVYRFSVYRLMVCLVFFPKLLLSERKTHSLTRHLSTGGLLGLTVQSHQQSEPFEVALKFPTNA